MADTSLSQAQNDSAARTDKTPMKTSWLSALLYKRESLRGYLLMSPTMLILTIGLIYGSWRHFDRSFDLTRPLWSRDSSIDIALPLWPAKLIVPVAFAILAARLALQLISYSRALISGAERPIGVPLPEDPMEVAAREAETVAGREGKP